MPPKRKVSKPAAAAPAADKKKLLKKKAPAAKSESSPVVAKKKKAAAATAAPTKKSSAVAAKKTTGKKNAGKKLPPPPPVADDDDDELLNDEDDLDGSIDFDGEDFDGRAQGMDLADDDDDDDAILEDDDDIVDFGDEEDEDEDIAAVSGTALSDAAGAKKLAAAASAKDVEKMRKAMLKGADTGNDKADALLLAADPETQRRNLELAREVGEHIDTRRMGAEMESDDDDMNDAYGELLRKEAQLALGTQQRHIVKGLPLEKMTELSRKVAVRTGAPFQNLFVGHNRNSVSSVAVFDTVVFYGDKSGVITRVDLATGHRQQLEQRHDGPVIALAVSDTRGVPQAMGLERTTVDLSVTSYLASGGDDGLIRIWQTETLKYCGEFKQHRAPVTGLTFRMHTNTLISVSEDKSVRVFACAEMLHEDHFFGHGGRIMAVAALKRERCATVGEDRVLRWWKTDQATQTEFKETSMPLECVAMLDDQTIVTAGRDGSLALYDVMKRGPLWSQEAVHGAGFTGDGTGLERLLLEEKNAVPSFPGPKKSAKKSAAVGSSSATATTSGSSTVASSSPFFANSISAMAAVPFSDLVLTGSCDGFVKVWRYTGFRVGAAQKLGEHQQAEQRGLELVGSLPVPGHVNAISIDRDASAAYCAVAKEPRHGRWSVNSGALNGIHVLPLTAAGLEAALVANVDVEVGTKKRTAGEAGKISGGAERHAAAMAAGAKSKAVSDKTEEAAIAAIVRKAKAPVDPKAAGAAAKAAEVAEKKKGGKRANKGANKAAAAAAGGKSAGKPAGKGAKKGAGAGAAGKKKK